MEGRKVGKLDTTLGYARLYDRTLAEDYCAAMEQVENRLEAGSPKRKNGASLRWKDDEHAELLALATRLAEPELGLGVRLDLVDQMCRMLNHKTLPDEKQLTKKENGRRPRAPP